MSLQVWLPLNGNINNQGISGTTFNYINNNNALSINNSGKIGKCYERTASGKADTLRSSSTFIFSEDISMCCWAYVTGTIGDTANGLITNHSHSDNTGVGITVKQMSTSDYRISCNTGIGNDRTFCTYYGTTNIKNAWHHLCLTYSKSKKQLKLWVDGKVEYTLDNYINAFKADYIDIFNWSTTYYTSGEYRPTCKLNDIRVYDHCLSPKEVKEISKGLCLHYKLGGVDGYFCGRNLLLKSAWESYYTSNSFTVNNKTYNTYGDGWGGYNSGISNPTINYHAYLDVSTRHYVFDETNGSRNWKGFGLSKGGSLNISQKNTSYIFSTMVKATGAGTKLFGGFYYYKTGTTSPNFYAGQFLISNISSGVESFVSAKVPLNNDVDWSKNFSFYIYGYGFSANSKLEMWHPKLEEGTKATSWTPAPSDNPALYNTNTEFDVSGFGNNASITGSISSDGTSPRYDVSYIFNNTSTYVNRTITTAGFSNSYTISYWAKKSNIDNCMAFGFADGNRLNLYPNSGTICWNTGDSAENPFQSGGTNIVLSKYNNNQWHHYTITGNGSVTTLYIDGVAVGNAKTYKAIGGSQLFISGWSTATEYKWTGGSISDFRMYATALSAADVKELYNTPISLTNTGVLMTQGEFKEV